MHNDPLLQILILLAASVCVVAGVRKLKLPAILGYLVVGMLLGPHALALAVDNDTTQSLAGLRHRLSGVTLGLEFSLPRLVAMRWEVLGVGGAQVLATTGLVAAGAVMFFKIEPAVAVVIGGAVAMSSTAIIIAQLTEQSENNRTHGRLAVAICLFQDLSFPLFLALVSALARHRRSRRRAPRSGSRHRRSRPAPGARRRTLAAAAAVLGDSLREIGGAVLARGIAGGARLGLGHSESGPVAGARCIPRRHDAGGNRVPASDRGDHPLLSRSAAGPFFHHGRHAAGRAPAHPRSAPGGDDSDRHAGAEGRGGGRGGRTCDHELVQVAAHGSGRGAGRRVRIRPVDAGLAARVGRACRRAAAAGCHGPEHGALAAVDPPQPADYPHRLERIETAADGGRCAKSKPRWPSPGAITS